MKNIKSKNLFVASIAVAVIFLVIGVGAVIYLFSQRNQPVAAPVQSMPTKVPVPPAVVTKAPDESTQALRPEEAVPKKQENMEPSPASLEGALSEASPSPLAEPSEQPAEIPEIAGIQPENPVVSPAPASALELISREEAGLDTVPRLDFSGFTLNPRLHELVLEDLPYTNEDMKNGIEQPYLITERFQETIIESVSIGTSLAEVIRILGAPSFRERDMTVYKTEAFYLAFYGAQTVELASFLPAPRAYDENILNSILAVLCIDKVHLTDWLWNSGAGSDFFEESGFIHGGGNYAISSNGIHVDTLSEYIQVYNNFEGSLYKSNTDTPLSLIYTNTDSHLDSIHTGFLSHIFMNEAFETTGKASPSGRYIALYEWITSMQHHFTIRTVDHSTPDYQIGAVANDFWWLNDDYIVYTAMFTSLPAVLRVTEDDASHENILLMEGIDESDYFYGYGDYDFILEEITPQAIIFRDKGAEAAGGKVLWEFYYSFDETGKFMLQKDENQENVSEEEQG